MAKTGLLLWARASWVANWVRRGEANRRAATIVARFLGLAAQVESWRIDRNSVEIAGQPHVFR